MQNSEPGFYFALPRLIARIFGGNSVRTETNWLEANVAGGLIHGVAYLFVAQLCWRGLERWQQLLLLLPLAALVWTAWLLTLYVNYLIVRRLRAIGMLRQTPDDRAQGLLIAAMTTAFAVALLNAGGFFAFAGGVWIAVLALNLAAGGALALLRATNAA
ncbi:MAG: hypothetical protein ABI946_05430 [Chthoniobacterales bacterium]